MTRKHTRQFERYRELADAINREMAGVPSGWQGLEPPERMEYGRRVDAWHRLMSDLYDGLYADVAAARVGDAAAIDRLITFLEADVVCHRSGYFKVDAIRALSHADFDEASSERLERVVLAAVDGSHRREFRAYARLALKVDGPALRAELAKRMASADPRTRRHAKWTMQALAQDERHGRGRPVASSA